jgi:hypothetical protein
MDAAPHWIRRSSHPSPPTAVVCAQVRRLEELTIRKLIIPTVEDSMPSPKRLDHEAIMQDFRAGMSRGQLAAKYQAHKSTIRWHALRDTEAPQEKSPKPDRPISEPAAPTPVCADDVATLCPQVVHHLESNPGPPPVNGHTTFNPAELETLLQQCWNRLPTLERVRILLSRE